MKGMAFENSDGAQINTLTNAVFFHRSVHVFRTGGQKPAVPTQQRRKRFFVNSDQQQQRSLHFLFVLDFNQGVQKQVFRLLAIAAIEPFFHGDPQVAGLVKQEPIQPEAFFHFSFNKISLD
jgi:hypothetical protein